MDGGMIWGYKYHHLFGNSHVTSDVVDGFRLLCSRWSQEFLFVNIAGTAGTAPFAAELFHLKTWGQKNRTKALRHDKGKLLQRSTSNPFTHGKSAFLASLIIKRPVFFQRSTVVLIKASSWKPVLELPFKVSFWSVSSLNTFMITAVPCPPKFLFFVRQTVSLKEWYSSLCKENALHLRALRWKPKSHPVFSKWDIIFQKPSLFGGNPAVNFSGVYLQRPIIQGFLYQPETLPRNPVMFSDDDLTRVSNHFLSTVFRFKYYSQKVIGSLGTVHLDLILKLLKGQCAIRTPFKGTLGEILRRELTILKLPTP